jgi:hypothetical protein
MPHGFPMQTQLVPEAALAAEAVILEFLDHSPHHR